MILEKSSLERDAKPMTVRRLRCTAQPDELSSQLEGGQLRIQVIARMS